MADPTSASDARRAQTSPAESTAGRTSRVSIEGMPSFTSRGLNGGRECRWEVAFPPPRKHPVVVRFAAALREKQ